MGQSAGAGSPVFFQCPVSRQERGMYGRTARHIITLTGRTKPYKASMFSAIGQRSTFTSREYTCSCGHKGWSNHVDLELFAKQKGMD